jgi:hypothetical protein
MAISAFEIKRCEKELDKFLAIHRPPVHIRNEMDIGYRIKDQSVEIFEIRPHGKERSKKIETPVAKTTYVKSQGVWKIFWYMSDMKWHGYEPTPEVNSIEAFLALVSEDENCCFFG